MAKQHREGGTDISQLGLDNIDPSLIQSGYVPNAREFDRLGVPIGLNSDMNTANNMLAEAQPWSEHISNKKLLPKILLIGGLVVFPLLILVLFVYNRKNKE